MNEDNKINFFDEPNLNDSLEKEENKIKFSEINEINQEEFIEEDILHMEKESPYIEEKNKINLIPIDFIDDNFLTKNNKSLKNKTLVDYKNLKEKIEKLIKNKKKQHLSTLRYDLERKRRNSFSSISEEEREKLISLINEAYQKEEKKEKKDFDRLKIEIENAIQNKDAKKLYSFKCNLRSDRKYPEVKTEERKILTKLMEKEEVLIEFEDKYKEKRRKQTNKEDKIQENIKKESDDLLYFEDEEKDDKRLNYNFCLENIKENKIKKI